MTDAAGEPETGPLALAGAWALVVGLPVALALLALRPLVGGGLTPALVSRQLAGGAQGWPALAVFPAALLAIGWATSRYGAGPVRVAGRSPLCFFGYAGVLALAGIFLLAPGGVSFARAAWPLYRRLGVVGLNALLVLAGAVPYLLVLTPWKELRAERLTRALVLAFFLPWGYVTASLFKLLLGSAYAG